MNAIALQEKWKKGKKIFFSNAINDNDDHNLYDWNFKSNWVQHKTEQIKAEQNRTEHNRFQWTLFLETKYNDRGKPYD